MAFGQVNAMPQMSGLGPRGAPSMQTVASSPQASAPAPATGPTVGFGGNALGNYGGTPDGAAKAFGNYAALGTAAQSNAAPQIGSANVNADSAMQMNGLGLLGQTANGQGPAIAAARNQLATNTAQGIQSNNAIANSATGGGRGLAAAQGTAGLQNAQATGGLTNQQNAVAANMQAQAQQQYATAAGGIQSANAQGAAQNANLQQQQGQLNNQGQLGFLGLGNAAMTGQLGAQSSQYATTLAGQQGATAAAQAANNAKNSGILGGLVGLGTIAATAA